MSDLPELDPVEQRVLGSLLEKEITVPATYPMTLNAVRTACNQSSSRDPVVDYDERTVNAALRRLRDQELVTTSWAGTGQRSVKFAETIAPRRDWQPAERALLTVLLLRGPQPAGALKTRTERLHAFADRVEVEQTLAAMAAAQPPLVRELPRQVGQHDPRWIHLLGPVQIASAATLPEADSEQVLSDGAQARDDSVRASYGAIATAYAQRHSTILEDLPFERWLLDRVVDLAGPHSIIDAGCGPGHVTAYLAARGADVTGIDFTEEMVHQAIERYPEGRYAVGDLRQLMRPPRDDGWGVVLGWHSLIHMAKSELPEAISALVRPLRPGGWLLLGLHAGTEVVHGAKWFDAQIALSFVQHSPQELVALLHEQALIDIEWYVRGPQRDEQIQHLYVLARQP